MRELRGARPPRPKPDDPGRLSPDQPVWEVDGDQREAEEGAAASQGRALVPDTPVPARIVVDDPAATGERRALGGAGPPRTWPRAPGRRSGRGWRVLAIVLALGLFAAGTAVGSVLAGRSTERARPATAAATSVAPTTAAPTTTAPGRQLAPPACLSAVDDADAVISYLVANVRDHRLARTLQQYRAASRTCRRAS